MKYLVFIICVFLCHAAMGGDDGGTAKKLQAARKALDKASGTVLKVSAFIAKANPAKIFADLSKALVCLGPAMMIVGTVLSIVAMFLPQEDSPELKAINAGFEKVNLRLDVITSQIRDLKNVVELSGAKSAYAKSITAIENNYINFHEATQENIKASYDYFVKQYESSYNLAADNLFDAMTGKLGPFGFNLVNLYKDHVKCNPLLVSKFCTTGMQMLTKALTVEGAYLGALNLSEKAKSKQTEWEVKMQTIADTCGSVINSCEDNWKVSSAQQFRETYNKDMSDNNQEFAQKIADSLNEVVPQRSWLAVSYMDASGFGEHGFSSYYEADKIWDQHSHDVTIFSTTPQEPMVGDNFESWKRRIEGERSKLASACDLDKWLSGSGENFGKKDTRSLNNVLRKGFGGGVVYSIRSDKNPGQAATGNTIYTADLSWKCNSENYRVIVFV